jgi:hypothetical protein
VPAPFVTLDLSALQLGAGILIVFAAVALSFLLGLDEGKVRGRIDGRRLAQEAREKARQQLADEHWIPVGRHRS